MGSKRKKVKHHRLSADERPLFVGFFNKVHLTKKDIANTRREQKLQLKKELQNLDD